MSRKFVPFVATVLTDVVEILYPFVVELPEKSVTMLGTEMGKK